MSRIAVISRAESDVSRVLEHSGHEVRMIHPDEVVSHDLRQDDAIAILGGVSAEPILLGAPARIAVDREIAAGKRVFSEYVLSISDIYFTGPEQLRLALEWLVGGEGGIVFEALERPVAFRSVAEGEPLQERLRRSVVRATRWFERAGMLLANGTAGVKEGASGTVHPDGRQEVLSQVRNDCSGEAGMLYSMHHLLTGDPRSLATSDNLHDFCMRGFQVRDGGPFHGMMRWSEAGWPVCYQDDAARVLIPILLKNLYGHRGYQLTNCVEALQFLVRTTGTDGTRVPRTDMNLLPPEKLAALRTVPGGCPSAHYNAFYLGALALCAKVIRGMGRDARWAGAFADVAVETAAKGLGTIMAAYPNTRREMSETEELCRLVAPLAWLCWATGDATHRSWLDRVVADLERFRHPSGGYAEWDTGTTATCARNENGECALLANNGDPVADLLYSLNWLPIGFLQAWFVTGEPHFLRRWEGIARFMASAQIESRDPLLDGGWARALDMERWEVFAVPFDVGWGPWAIESGWTVAEIASGLAMGLLRDDLERFYR